MPVTGWSATASANTTVAGISIAEGMARASVNDAIRGVMSEAVGGFAEVYSVKAAGAKGDGSTDDTAAINSAISTCLSSGLRLYFPAGTYMTTGLTATMTGSNANSKLQIEGAGRRTTKIKLSSGTNPVLHVTCNSIPLQAHLDIRDITIDGLLKAGDGIKLTGVAHSSLTRVLAEDCNKALHGIGALILNIEDCSLQTSKIGAYFRKSTAWANSISLRECKIKSNTISGVDFGEGSLLRIRDCDLEDNGTPQATVTISNASPGVVTWTAHGLPADTEVQFTTTGALPTGLTASTPYYVSATGLTTNTFQVSATVGGASINTTSAGSGVHTGLAVGTGGVMVRATTDDETGYGMVIVDGTWFENNKGRAFQAENTANLNLSIADGKFLTSEGGRAIYVAGANHVTLKNLLLPSGIDVANITCSYLTASESLLANLSGTQASRVEINETSTGTPVSGIRVAGGHVDVTTGEYRYNAVKIAGARKTGWATATGTATRTTFDTATVTLPLLAERVKALIDDLHATAGHGMIGT